MRRPKIVDLNIFFVKYAFNTRFFLASLSKKSKIAHKIINDVIFEDDETIIIPNTTKLNKKIDSNSENSSKNITINKKIEDEESTFLPTDILKEVVKQASNIVIMNKCLCRTSNDCKDFPQDIGCIFMGPTSKRIPKHLGREATVEEAIEHINQADAVGLSHLVGRNKIDTLWMHVKPKEELLTVCHCCPCCCLWAMLPNLKEDISEKVKKLEGVEIKTHKENCNLCKRCLNETICFTDAITLNEETNQIEIDQKKCRGCGRCANICNKDAISISYTKNTVQKVLNRLDELIDYKK